MAASELPDRGATIVLSRGSPGVGPRVADAIGRDLAAMGARVLVRDMLGCDLMARIAEEIEEKALGDAGISVNFMRWGRMIEYFLVTRLVSVGDAWFSGRGSFLAMERCRVVAELWLDGTPVADGPEHERVAGLEKVLSCPPHEALRADCSLPGCVQGPVVPPAAPSAWARVEGEVVEKTRALFAGWMPHGAPPDGVAAVVRGGGGLAEVLAAGADVALAGWGEMEGRAGLERALGALVDGGWEGWSGASRLLDAAGFSAEKAGPRCRAVSAVREVLRWPCAAAVARLARAGLADVFGPARFWGPLGVEVRGPARWVDMADIHLRYAVAVVVPEVPGLPGLGAPGVGALGRCAVRFGDPLTALPRGDVWPEASGFEALEAAVAGALGGGAAGMGAAQRAEVRARHMWHHRMGALFPELGGAG